MKSQPVALFAPHHRALAGCACGLMLLFMIGCGSTSGGGFDGYGGDYGTVPTGSSGGGKASTPPSGSDSGSATKPAPSKGTGKAGKQPQPVNASQLTAGEWDDNLNFGLFKTYIGNAMQSDSQLPDLKATGRKIITVVDGDKKPVAGARVRVFSDGVDYFQGPTGTDGRVLWLPTLEGDLQAQDIQVEVAPPGSMNVDPTVTPLPEGDQWTLTLKAKASVVTKADVAFVFDATGSMGDELNWLKKEIADIAAKVAKNHPNVSLRLALIVYRDHGDAYLTRSFDFTDDLDVFLGNLKNQKAGGGGDYPEAMDSGLSDMNQLSWRQGAVARMAFVVADAPPKTQNLQKAIDQALIARAQGIRLYGVAASGVGDRAEYILRGMAWLTLARYIFLTDDSGIGNSHAEPHIPCHHVMLLNTLMVRTIEAEIAGKRTHPDNDDIIKTVGNPEQGQCQLSNGDVAWL